MAVQTMLFRRPRDPRTIIRLAGVACAVLAGPACGDNGAERGDDLTGRAAKRPRIIAEISTGQVQGVTAGAGSVWTADHREDTVSRIDPATNEVAATIPVGSHPGNLGFAAGSVWVPVYWDARLARIDPRTNKVVASVPVRAFGVAAGAGSVWALTWDGAEPGPFNEWEGRTVARIDPSTNEVAARIRLRTGPIFGVAVGEGAVWVAAEPRWLVRIDPRANRVTAKIRVGLHPDRVDVGAGGVWVTVAGGYVVRVDPATNRVVARIRTGTGAQPVAVGLGAVWVGNINEISNSTMSRIDPQTNRVSATISVGDAPTGVALEAGSVWVGTYEDAKVWRIRP